MNTTHTTFASVADLAGRVLISAMFLTAGLAKVGGYAGTQAYMAAAGVPGALLPLVIALEVLGAIAIVVGFRTRIVAAGLAVFTVAAAVLFHSGADEMQQLLFMKNLAIAGGFLFLVARGAGDWSFDARRERLTAAHAPVVARP
ncbi:MAG TPA: DoxX family protein [Steroidobacteraceae bacterium]|nr:DoxX family protein [Steroidobacteraceae bacterium]